MLDAKEHPTQLHWSRETSYPYALRAGSTLKGFNSKQEADSYRDGFYAGQKAGREELEREQRAFLARQAPSLSDLFKMLNARLLEGDDKQRSLADFISTFNAAAGGDSDSFEDLLGAYDRIEKELMDVVYDDAESA